MIIEDNLPEIIRKITTLFTPESVKLAFCFASPNHLKNCPVLVDEKSA